MLQGQFINCPYRLTSNGTERFQPSRWTGPSKRWTVDLATTSVSKILHRGALVLPADAKRMVERSEVDLPNRSCRLNLAPTQTCVGYPCLHRQRKSGAYQKISRIDVRPLYDLRFLLGIGARSPPRSGQLQCEPWCLGNRASLCRLLQNHGLP